MTHSCLPLLIYHKTSRGFSKRWCDSEFHLSSSDCQFTKLTSTFSAEGHIFDSLSLFQVRFEELTNPWLAFPFWWQILVMYSICANKYIPCAVLNSWLTWSLERWIWCNQDPLVVFSAPTTSQPICSHPCYSSHHCPETSTPTPTTHSSWSSSIRKMVLGCSLAIFT